jgi:UDP-glucose 4-epimerase
VGQVVNVGSQQEITIADLAKLVKEVAGSESPIVLVPYDQAYEEGFEDMQRRVPEVAKLRGLVGFSPQMGIRAIVESVVAHYRQR